MHNENKRYVQVVPVNQTTPYFISNIKPGDVVCFQSSDISRALKNESLMLNQPVTVVYETPYLIQIDLGKYKISVSKASIYCKNEVLYFYEPDELP